MQPVNELKRRAVLALTGFIILFLVAFGVQGAPVSDDLAEPETNSRSEAYYRYVVAKMAEAEGLLPEAREQLRRVLELDPSSSFVHSEIASLFLREMKWAESEEECRRALELDPDNSDAHRILGLLHFHKFQVAVRSGLNGEEDLADAIREFTELTRIRPRDPGAFLTLGQWRYFSGDADGARESLLRCLQIAPRHPEALYFLAEANFELGETEQALDSLKRVASLPAAGSRAFDRLSEVLQKTDRTGEYVEFLEGLVDSGSDSIEVLTRLGEIKARRAQTELDAAKRAEYGAQALSLLQRAEQLEPDNSVAAYYLCFLYRQAGDPERSLAACSSHQRRNQDDPTVQYALAADLVELGRNQEAAEAIDELILIAPEWAGEDERDRLAREQSLFDIATLRQMNGQDEESVPVLLELELLSRGETLRSARIQLALALLRLERLQEASEVLDRALDDAPNDEDLTLLKGELLLDRDRSGEAVNLVTELLSEGKEPPSLRAVLGGTSVLLRARQLEKALEVLLKAEKTYPEDERILFQIGAVYERMGDIANADRYLSMCIYLDAENAEALNYLGYMLADNDLELDRSLAYLKRAVHIDSTSGAFLDSLGWVYFKLDQLDQAEEYLDRAARIVGDDPVIHDHLGDLYYRKGNLEAALESWSRSLEQGIEDPDRIRQKISTAEQELSQIP